ncbi:hypothetical protein CHUAL_013115 [Chamberlinius hualienensis]
MGSQPLLATLKVAHTVAASAKMAFKRMYCTKSRKLVLGIETSFDETGAAVVDNDGRVLGEALHSQKQIHLNFGGNIPTFARDMHEQNIDEVVTTALRNANVTLNDLDAIATTVKPGMGICLAVGMRYGKKIAKEFGKPFIPIHHMEAHALTARMIEKIKFPFLTLLVSGGHCILSVVQDVDKFVTLGSTLDDAPGEAFDKTSRRLKLKNLRECSTLSGGESIELLARKGNPLAFPYPIPLLKYRSCNFSFAGLKTSARRSIILQEKAQNIAGGTVLPNAADICASFQWIVTRHILQRMHRATIYAERENLILEDNKVLVVSGGVASNGFIRKAINIFCEQLSYQVVFPPSSLCSDNGIMIAWNGMERLQANIGVTYDLDSVDIEATSPLGEDISAKVFESSIKLPRIIRVEDLLSLIINASEMLPSPLNECHLLRERAAGDSLNSTGLAYIWNVLLGNYESSYTFENQTIKCYEHLKRMLNGLYNKEEWALSLVDAFGKPGSGIMEGNVRWAGNYHQCLHVNTNEIKGRYCWLEFPLNTNNSEWNKTFNKMTRYALRTAICVPNTCGKMEIMEIVQALKNNPIEMGKVLSYWHMQLPANFYYFVDIFFIITGFLTMQTVIEKFVNTNSFRRVKFVIIYIVHRYWRLVTTYGLVLFVFRIGLLPYFASGPFYEDMDPYCRYEWWKNLLLISNWLPLDKQCYPMTWYMSCSMQLHLMGLIILLPIFNSRFKWISILNAVIVLIVSCYWIGWVSYTMDIPANYSAINRQEISNYLEKMKLFKDRIYMTPFYHFGSYAIGMVTGWILYHYKDCIKLNKKQAITGWTTCAILEFGTIHLMYFEPNCLIKSFHSALAVTLWSLSIAWVIVACISGHGGFIHHLLAWKYWTPLSKLTLTIYLLQSTVIDIMCYSEKWSLHFSEYNFFGLLLRHLLVTAILAVPVSLAFESPVFAIERFLLKRFMPKHYEYFHSTNNIIIQTISYYFNSNFNNLNESSAKCYEDLKTTIKAIYHKEEWALTMIDAFGKPGSGILEGNAQWAGNYQQCLNANSNEIRGRYCWLEFPANAIVSFLKQDHHFTHHSIKTAICVPNTCNDAELMKLADFIQAKISSYFDMKTERTSVNVTCVGINESKIEQDPMAIIAM